jgi:hypothetical protein
LIVQQLLWEKCALGITSGVDLYNLKRILNMIV